MDKDLAIVLTNLSIKVLDLEIKNRVMTDILVESKSITTDELDEKYKVVEENDFKNARKELLESLNDFVDYVK